MLKNSCLFKRIFQTTQTKLHIIIYIPIVLFSFFVAFETALENRVWASCDPTLLIGILESNRSRFDAVQNRNFHDIVHATQASTTQSPPNMVVHIESSVVKWLNDRPQIGRETTDRVHEMYLNILQQNLNRNATLSAAVRASATDHYKSIEFIFNLRSPPNTESSRNSLTTELEGVLIATATEFWSTIAADATLNTLRTMITRERGTIARPDAWYAAGVHTTDGPATPQALQSTIRRAQHAARAARNAMARDLEVANNGSVPLPLRNFEAAVPVFNQSQIVLRARYAEFAENPNQLLTNSGILVREQSVLDQPTATGLWVLSTDAIDVIRRVRRQNDRVRYVNDVIEALNLRFSRDLLSTRNTQHVRWIESMGNFLRELDMWAPANDITAPRTSVSGHIQDPFTLFNPAPPHATIVTVDLFGQGSTNLERLQVALLSQQTTTPPRQRVDHLIDAAGTSHDEATHILEARTELAVEHLTQALTATIRQGDVVPTIRIANDYNAQNMRPITIHQHSGEPITIGYFSRSGDDVIMILNRRFTNEEQTRFRRALYQRPQTFEQRGDNLGSHFAGRGGTRVTLHEQTNPNSPGATAINANPIVSTAESLEKSARQWLRGTVDRLELRHTGIFINAILPTPQQPEPRFRIIISRASNASNTQPIDVNALRRHLSAAYNQNIEVVVE